MTPAADRGARDDGLRVCSKCGVRKCWPANFRDAKSATCKPCWAKHQHAWASANRERLRAQAWAKREEARAARVSRPERADAFATTMRHLETRWGRPYSKWTRDQHAQHTEILRKLAGIDDAPREDRADAA